MEAGLYVHYLPGVSGVALLCLGAVPLAHCIVALCQLSLSFLLKNTKNEDIITLNEKVFKL